MILRTFLKDSAIYAIPSFLSNGLSLILIPLYTRVLTPEDYGVLDLLLVFARLALMTISLEVYQAVARFYGQADSDISHLYSSSALWFTLSCYSIFVFFSFLWSEALSSFIIGETGFEATFQIAIFYIWISGVLNLAQNQFRWELRSTKYAISGVIMVVSTASLAVYLTYVCQLGINGLLVGMCFGPVVGTIYSLLQLRGSFRFRFDYIKLKEMLSYSSPLVVSSLAVFISMYIDRIMINYYLSVEDVGIYGVAYRLSGVAGLLMVGFQGALTPLIFKHYKNTETPKSLEKIFRIFLVLALSLWLIMALFSKDILVLMTTPEYYEAAQLILFLVPAIILSQMYIFAPGIEIAKKTYLNIRINIMGAILNVVLNYILIPHFGIVGAASATLLSYISIFSVKMAFSQTFYHVPHQWIRILFSTALVIALALVVSFSTFDQGIKIIVNLMTVVIAVICFVYSGLIKYSELLKLKTVVFSK